MYLGQVKGEGKDIKEILKDFARAINAILNGNINSGNSVTLRASQTTTVVTNRLISPDTVMILAATTATAATAASKVHQAYTGQYEITLTHDSNAAIDRTFKYVLLG